MHEIIPGFYGYLYLRGLTLLYFACEVITYTDLLSELSVYLALSLLMGGAWLRG